ncbi:mevalonate kinase [Streptomyces sp. NBC_00435]|uniref:mevalonate kinase n=1 Tax=Streptomyces sp. NBC_00435 TaxID=2903649 RepID=UPI002E1C4F7A
MTRPIPTGLESRTGGANPSVADGVSGSGAAHAKAILLGEHAAVYGAPSLAVPLPAVVCRATVTPRYDSTHGLVRIHCSPMLAGTGKGGPVFDSTPPGLGLLVDAVLRRPAAARFLGIDVELASSIPPSRGLGSSAALARAVTRALDDLLGLDLTDQEVFDYVQLSESAAHGQASGIDALTTGATRPVLLSGGRPSTPPVGCAMWIVVADSGTPGSTRRAVTMLRTYFDTHLAARDRFLAQSTAITERALHALEQGHLPIAGACLTETHQLLSNLDLSTERIDRLVGAALEYGALGAKLSGGGLGGCMIALTGTSAGADALASRLLEHGAAHTWTTMVERSGGAG